MEKQYLAWEVGFCREETDTPAEFMPATVPGAVQLDYARAHGWKPYWQEKDISIYDWMEDVYWVYRAPVTVPDSGASVLVFKGIDYRYRISLDGTVLLEGEGMFSHHRLDVSAFAGKTATLEVRLSPIPKAPIIYEGRDQAKESCKAAVSYGWDFHPRLVPTGLWDEVYLEWGAPAALISCDAAPAVTEDLSAATVAVTVCLDKDAAVRVELCDPAGNCVASESAATAAGRLDCSLSVEHPALWWPNGYGDQPLYTLRILLTDTAQCLYEKKIGFRRVSLEMNDGEWRFPDEFPKSRSTAPITLTVNGRRLFAKGSNWIPPDVFFGRITADTYEQLLTLAHDAHMNILRVWGGGITNKEAFYEICDRLGLMIWQEFPLGCNLYPDKPAYLQVLRQEATAIVRRLRVHPCVVLWCGGNELFNCWSGMTDQSHPLRLLNSICFAEDPGTPFLMTSPLFGMGHGHYRHLDSPDTEFITKLVDCKNTAYTEFGVPGCNTLEYVYEHCDKADFDACRNVEEMHQLLPFYNSEPVVKKLSPDALCYYYGEEGTPLQVIERLAFLQGMCYKSLFEEMRKQWPRCSMAINWCFDAPWSMLCNENLVDWPCSPKPAYAEVRQALRGQLASLRVRGHLYDGGGDFTAEVWLLNDTLQDMEQQTVEVYGVYEGERKLLLTWTADETPAQTNQRGPAVYWKLPRRNADERFTIEVCCVGHPEYTSTYRYLLKPTEESRKVMTLNGL